MNLEMILEEFIINYGLLSIFILVALEYANLPLPSEVNRHEDIIWASYHYRHPFLNQYDEY